MDYNKTLERRFFSEWVKGHSDAPTFRDAIAWSNERALRDYCEACQFKETCQAAGECGDINTFRAILEGRA